MTHHSPTSSNTTMARLRIHPRSPTAMPTSNPGDTIPLGGGRMLGVIATRVGPELDDDRVLVIEAG
jgi:hypothetical protein